MYELFEHGAVRMTEREAEKRYSDCKILFYFDDSSYTTGWVGGIADTDEDWSLLRSKLSVYGKGIEVPVGAYSWSITQGVSWNPPTGLASAASVFDGNTD
jgi:hypothetical protein